MRLTNLALLSTGLCFALFACRGSDSNDPPPPDVPVGGSVTVKEVQADTMPVGTAVELHGVVVTAIDTFGARTGDLWVQDTDGGAFSGVKVFGAPLDQIAALQPGDLVDITNGEKDEFALTSDTSGRKVTEIKGAAGGMLTITKKGTGTIPTPQVVDAKMIATMDKATREAEWEKWEGVLIKVTNARQLAAERTFGSTPGDDSHEFRITGIARVQSVLAALNADNGFGVCYDSIIGIGDYFFNDLVLPRSAADIASGGAGCNPMPTSVAMAQTTPGAELVNLTNVVVTARDDLGTNNKGFWVADSLAAAANQGVYVFTGSTAPDAGLVIGAKANIQGSVEEFDIAPTGMTIMGDTLTEVSGPPVITNIQAPAGPPVPLTTATVAQLGDIGATGEPFEGVLVSVVQPMKVTANLMSGKWELTANNGDKLVLDDDSFAIAAPTVGTTCYTTVTGVMNVQLFDNLRTINPRAQTDVTVGGGCN